MQRHVSRRADVVCKRQTFAFTVNVCSGGNFLWQIYAVGLDVGGRRVPLVLQLVAGSYSNSLLTHCVRVCVIMHQVLVGHPLDTIKVRIQTMEVVPGQPPPYKGMVDCASQIIKKEGVSFLCAR